MGDICTCFDFEPDFSTQCYIAWHCTAFPILSNLYLLLLAISSTWAVCAKLRSAAAGSCSACTFCRKVWPSCGSMDCSRFWIPLTSVKANWNSTLWKKFRNPKKYSWCCSSSYLYNAMIAPLDLMKVTYPWSYTSSKNKITCFICFGEMIKASIRDCMTTSSLLSRHWLL